MKEFNPVPEVIAWIKWAETRNNPLLKPIWDDSAATPNKVEYAVGYGHQIQPGEEWMMNGITRAQADDIFLKDLKKIGQPIANFLNKYKPDANDYQFSALLDLSYNAGPYGWQNWPLGLAIKAGKSDEEIIELLKKTALQSMNKKTGKLEFRQSHADRRAWEAELYKKKIQ